MESKAGRSKPDRPTSSHAQYSTGSGQHAEWSRLTLSAPPTPWPFSLPLQPSSGLLRAQAASDTLQSALAWQPASKRCLRPARGQREQHEQYACKRDSRIKCLYDKKSDFKIIEIISIQNCCFSNTLVNILLHSSDKEVNYLPRWP